MAFGPGDAVASSGSDGIIKVFSSAGRGLAASPSAGEWLYSVAFGSDDGTVFAGDFRGRRHRFDIEARKLVATAPLLQDAPDPRRPMP